MVERTFTTSKSNKSAASRLVSLALAALLLVAAIFSSTKLSSTFSTPETYAHQLEQLDKRQETVTNLSVASATASCIVSLIPDDACTPIANQLSNVSMACAAILGTILLEKYALTILGFVLFGIAIPVCCLGFSIACMLSQDSDLRSRIIAVSTKVLLVCLVLWAVTPTGIFLADKIDETYAASSDVVAEAIDSASSVSEILEQENKQDESKPWFEGLASVVADPSSAFDSVAAKAQELIGWAQHVLSDFVEGLAVMAVTTCVIPLATLSLAMWVVRIALQPMSVVMLPKDIETLAPGGERFLPARDIRRRTS